MRVCSHSSCPDKRNGCSLSSLLNSDLFVDKIFERSNLLTWNNVYRAVITSDDNYTAWLHEVLLIVLMEQPTVTNPAVVHGLCAMTEQLIGNVLLAQACPMMMNHLTITSKITIAWKV